MDVFFWGLKASPVAWRPSWNNNKKIQIFYPKISIYFFVNFVQFFVIKNLDLDPDPDIDPAPDPDWNQCAFEKLSISYGLFADFFSKKACQESLLIL